jgi:RNA polymerase sigma factor (sigma-70 family)
VTRTLPKKKESLFRAASLKTTELLPQGFGTSGVEVECGPRFNRTRGCHNSRKSDDGVDVDEHTAMTTPNDLRSQLSNPTLLRALAQAIRAKVPASDVEDVVQSTLADALAAAEPPNDPTAFERWLFGIARHKVADYYRRNRRHEVVDSDAVATSTNAATAPESARDLLRWVDQELPKEPETTRTLEWMMREASGDRLETIAQEQDVSAPAVRQRVSRLRRFLRERWALELAAALGLLVVVTGIFAYRQNHARPPIGPEPVVRLAPLPAEQARKLRETALKACRAGEWKPCLTDLDRAKELDLAGDSASEVQEARIGAARALNPAPAPSPSIAPTSTESMSKRATPPVLTKPPAPPKKATSVKGPQQQEMLKEPSTPAKQAPAVKGPQNQEESKNAATKSKYGATQSSKADSTGDFDFPRKGK